MNARWLLFISSIEVLGVDFKAIEH